VESVYGGFDDTGEPLVHCLLLDRVRFGRKASCRHRAILHLPSTFTIGGPQFARRRWTWLTGQEGYYFRWEAFRKATAKFPLGKRLFQDFFSDVIPEDTEEYDYTEVYACLKRTLKQRRFMKTDQGFFGWAPDKTYGSKQQQSRKGDIITITLGCSTLSVIRAHGDRFQVLGEAYVEGLMDGEAMHDDFEKEQRLTLTFC
jgi:hypothetical protein